MTEVLRELQTPPLVRGLGLTAIPRPAKLHFSLGRAIATSRCRGRSDDPAVLKRVRDRVAGSLRQLIAELREYRAQDSRQGTLRRVLNRL